MTVVKEQVTAPLIALPASPARAAHPPSPIPDRPLRGSEGGGRPHLHPDPCRPSDWASHLGSGPHGSGPGPRETPAAGAQGPPPRGGGCGRLGAGARPRPGSWGRLRGAALGGWEPRGRVPAPLSQRGANGGPSASWAIGNGLLGGSGGAGPGRKTLE